MQHFLRWGRRVYQSCLIWRVLSLSEETGKVTTLGAELKVMAYLRWIRGGEVGQSEILASFRLTLLKREMVSTL